MAKFLNTFCSQCGAEFGPGDNGFSHCTDHRMEDEMRYSDWEQRQMDIKSGEEQDRYMRKHRLAQPCKNEGNVAVEQDGSCLRCGAAQGEICRPV